MRSQAPSTVAIVAQFLALAACMPACAQTWDLAALRAFAGLTEDQWKAVNRGDLQARTLGTREKREVAVVGVARLRASSGCFVTMLQDIENFKKNPAVLRIRKFAIPVDPRDLEGLRLENNDLADLRVCRAGNCKVKFPVGVMERLGDNVDWSQPDRAAMAQSMFREQIQAYIQTYSERGNPALIEYHDKRKTVRLADEFRAVLDARPGVDSSRMQDLGSSPPHLENKCGRSASGILVRIRSPFPFILI